MRSRLCWSRFSWRRLLSSGVVGTGAAGHGSILSGVCWRPFCTLPGQAASGGRRPSISALVELPPAVSRLAQQRMVGADQRRTGPAKPPQAGSGGNAHGGHHRLAKRQNSAKREQRGYDAGKRIKGRKRHIAVDRNGHLLAAVVHSASVQNSAGARLLLPLLAARLSFEIVSSFKKVQALSPGDSSPCNSSHWAHL